MPQDMTQVFAAMRGGGGPPVPSAVADAFQQPPGIPDPRAAVGLGEEELPPNIQEMLRAGHLSAAELLEMIALLAGLGGAPPTAPTQGSEVQQAFAEGGGLPGGPQGGPQGGSQIPF